MIQFAIEVPNDTIDIIFKVDNADLYTMAASDRGIEGCDRIEALYFAGRDLRTLYGDRFEPSYTCANDYCNALNQAGAVYRAIEGQDLLSVGPTRDE